VVHQDTAELSTIPAMKNLDINDVGVTIRTPFDDVLPFITHALIEAWGLEAVCR
jgi:hypothetical protein